MVDRSIKVNELLSAYLDGELSSREAKKLEARLSADVKLKISLEELRHTRRLLQAVPSLKVPRDFVLTPSMIKDRNVYGGWFQVMRLASTLAMILFVVVVVGDVVTNGSRAAGNSTSMSSLESASDAAVGDVMEMAVEAPEAAMQEAEQGIAADLPDEAMDDSFVADGEMPATESSAISEESALSNDGDDVDSIIESPEQTTERAIEDQQAQLNNAKTDENINESINVWAVMIRVVEVGLVLIALITGLIAKFIGRRNQDTI